ncbi:MAG: response regulator transcription factor [Lachnospiraceae bacterium]|nr:response regulator transcription factor [Lachnospiraceae bacterium]MDD4525486.1 response regulator transcription factor [Lachnospiraceae bacterium]
MKILLAEDTRDLNRVETVALEHEGFDVDSVFDGVEALEKMSENGYDAIVLDIMMPKKDGLEVLTEMRARNIVTPTLMLTAKTEIDDRVAGLDAGADDYLTKPFAMKEFLARVRAMTRRKTVYAARKLKFGDFSLDSENFELACENSMRLSVKEFELLQTLVLNSDHEVDTDYLLEHVWEGVDNADGETVWLYISYLRGKLKSIASNVLIEGERDGNYRLVTEG